MEPTTEQLVMYGSKSETPLLDWQWVDEQLTTAAAYWIVTPTPAHPHPRPVWGVWLERRLYVSIGSPRLNATARRDGPVTAHLGDVNDVVIIEGHAAGPVDDRDVVNAYNAKYDWDYVVDAYGPFTLVVPSTVIAWRSGGWAGREGFQETGRWRFGT